MLYWEQFPQWSDDLVARLHSPESGPMLVVPVGELTRQADCLPVSTADEVLVTAGDVRFWSPDWEHDACQSRLQCLDWIFDRTTLALGRMNLFAVTQKSGSLRKTLLVGARRLAQVGITSLSGLPMLSCMEASVQYKGTVVVGASTEFTFDDVPNPKARSPLARAAVFVRVYDSNFFPGCSGSLPEDVTFSDQEGFFETPELVFGGPGPVPIQVCVVQQGFEPLEYRTKYPTADPAHGERFMNVILAPAR